MISSLVCWSDLLSKVGLPPEQNVILPVFICFSTTTLIMPLILSYLKHVFFPGAVLLQNCTSASWAFCSFQFVPLPTPLL